MYTITIDRLEIFANHGVMEEEKRLGQKFIVSVVAEIGCEEHNMGDDINNTISYGNLCGDIQYVVQGKMYNLIETLAQKIAAYVLEKYEVVSRINVKVMKPWAPIKKVVNSVSVEIERCKRKVCLNIGSNIEPREEYLNYAVKRFKQDNRINSVVVSEYFNTKPIGKLQQPDFLNASIVCTTYMEPYEMLEFIHKVENEAGRKREERWGPRTLDIDIILYGEVCINTDLLTIPHSEMANRLFVLEPLMQIAPYMINHVEKKNVYQLYSALKKKEHVSLCIDYDDYDPITKYERIKSGVKSNGLLLPDIVLLALYAINEQFKLYENRYFYIKDDNSVSYLINKTFDYKLDISCVRKAIIELDISKMIYRFNCALKFNVYVEDKQLRINSWGKKYIVDKGLDKTIEYKQLLESIRKIYMEYQKQYDELRKLLLMENINANKISKINALLNVKLLS